MIDYHEELVAALDAVLSTYYELALDSSIETPCISYMENVNYDDVTGDSLGYSRIGYKVTVHTKGNGALQAARNYAKQVDAVMRRNGFNRIASTELFDNESVYFRKILTYEALASETF